MCVCEVRIRNEKEVGEKGFEKKEMRGGGERAGNGKEAKGRKGIGNRKIVQS